MSLALYRRYRPETFAEVIGQEHVTGPLQQAIANGRVSHAYLFSGPRGCGKTTSARILARALNCEQGPTPSPCGRCSSCRDLARDGGGGLDVVEIDAASHGLVDDARDLRERAFFAPASARYKIYIIDEAHMVTTQAFNALLKVVEEPPEHLKFVFATTEPDKVIPTIRSRTHHYPFRLVPPGLLRDYLAGMCEKEGIAVEPAVLPLVVRAGAGSVRDSLSVLDQLIAGAGAGGLTTQLATGLLGYTDAALLDDVVDAFAAVDGAAVFSLIDRVIEGGHDPRQFLADLLERLRDLIIIAAVPGAAGQGLIDAPGDRLERMGVQAGQFGASELSRAADLLGAGLTEMRGATAPRLHLELVCARVLLPGAGDGERDLHARLDRLERRLAGPFGASGPSTPADAPAADGTPVDAPATDAPAADGTPADAPATDAPAADGTAADAPASDGTAADAPASDGTAADAPPPAGSAPPPEAARLAPAVDERPPAAPTLDVTTVRRMWPDLLEAVKTRKRFTWMTLMNGVGVAGVDDGVLTLAFADEGRRRGFVGSASEEVLREAVREVLRVDWRIDAVHDPGRAGGGQTAGGQTGRPAATQTAGTEPASAEPTGTEPTGTEPTGTEPTGTEPTGTEPTGTEPTGTEPTADPAAQPPASGARPPTREAAPPPGTRPARPERTAADAPAADDPDAADAGLSGRELLVRELGASVISEIDHERGPS